MPTIPAARMVATDLFRRGGNFTDDVGTAVNAFFPLVAVGFDGDHLFEVTDFADNLFNFDHFAGGRCMNVGGNNAVGIGEQRTDFDPVAFLTRIFAGAPIYFLTGTYSISGMPASLIGRSEVILYLSG